MSSSFSSSINIRSERDAVDRQQQKGQQKLLGRDRGASTVMVKPTKGWFEAIQSLIGKPPHLPKAMTGRDRTSVET